MKSTTATIAKPEIPPAIRQVIVHQLALALVQAWRRQQDATNQDSGSAILKQGDE